MDVDDLLTYIALGLVSAVVFFLKGLYSRFMDSQKQIATVQSDNEKLIGKLALLKMENEIVTKHIDKNESIMFKKFAGIHARQETQNTLNTEFKTMFATINTNLEILINKK